MPNMVDNIVSLVGPYDRIAELAEAAEANQFLQTVKPLSQFGLEQATAAWGVKWEIQNPLTYMHSSVHGYGSDKWALELQFESPWSPPLGAYDILHEEKVDILAYFVDTGGGNYGGTYKNGDLQTYDLENLPDEVVTIFNETYDYDRLVA